MLYAGAAVDALVWKVPCCFLLIEQIVCGFLERSPIKKALVFKKKNWKQFWQPCNWTYRDIPPPPLPLSSPLNSCKKYHPEVSQPVYTARIHDGRWQKIWSSAMHLACGFQFKDEFEVTKKRILHALDSITKHTKESKYLLLGNLPEIVFIFHLLDLLLCPNSFQADISIM